jgi:transcriptional regulator with AAA-type ATPase domain/tetratricopeptide (TPR) repeat protein
MREVKQLADLIGDSPGIEAIRERVVRLLQRQGDLRRLPPVLIEGETGTGKGLLARMIHKAGPRADGPFVDVNCAAIPETLLEAEMFGFERGAFTDARRAKPGLFQAAHRGTIFLDEVGLLSEPLQAKLLKVLEERSIRRLGATRHEHVDVWILTATNEDLRAAIQRRRFREDLYHRLAVLTLMLPPLRQRAGDVLTLAGHFLSRACADYGVPPKTLAADARAALLAYAWPGNVRELGNLMERVALLSSDTQVRVGTLGLPDVAAAPQSAAASASSLDDAVRDRVVDVLHQTRWNISRTAALLGISRNTLRARIEKYGLRQGETPAAPTPSPPRRAERRRTPPPPPPAEASPSAPPPVPATAPSPTPLRWERRRVTLLRATLIAPSSPEALLETGRALEVLLDKIRSFEGRIEGRSPAGIVAAFGLDPSEDAPSRAAHAAMAIVKAVERAKQEAGAGPSIRVAVHTSQFLVGQGAAAAELDVEGKQAALAILDALIARAEPDGVVVSETAAPFLERGFELHELPDASGQGRALALVGRGPVGRGARDRSAAFVGRHREIDLLQSRLESAIRGQGQIVGISGEAGIGKSRLLFEFRDGLAGAAVTYVEGQCRSYGAAIPYLPVLDVLKAMCAIADGDSPATVADKVRSSLLEAGMDLLETAPYLLHLLGVEPDGSPSGLEADATKVRVFETLRQLALKRSRQRPLVLVVEDLHWIDRTSEEYFASLAEIVAGARVLLISTYRSGYRPPWIERSYVTQVALQPLAPEDSQRVLRSVLDFTSVSERFSNGLMDLIVSKAEGNPFFLEELARTVREQVGRSPSLAVPDTVQEVLLGRIDRLAEEDRRLLEIAAVVGKDVPFSIVRLVTKATDDGLRRAFNRLKSAEFLYETSAGPDTEYTFKHTLTHEVAYGRLLAEARRDLHAQVVEAIERAYPERVAEHVEGLAHHAFEGAVWPKAHGYLRQAGVKAYSRSAHREAVAYYEQALDALTRLPESRERTEHAIDLRFDLRNALQPLGEFPRILEFLGEAEQLARALEDQRRLGQVSAFMTDYFRLMGDPDRAIEYGRQALALTETQGEFSTRVRANTYLAQTYYVLGSYRRAAALLDWNIESLGGELERQSLGFAQLPSVHSRTALVWCLAELGEFAEGIRRGLEGVRIAEAVDHPYTLVTAYAGIGSLQVRMGDFDAAIPTLERALDLCRSWHLSLWMPPVTSALGIALSLTGRADEAIPLLEEAAERALAMSWVGGQSMVLMCLADTSLLSGRSRQAAETAQRALDIAREHKERGREAWAWRLLGEIALRGDDQAGGSAEASFSRALTLGTELEMRPLIGRARLGLGRWQQKVGDRAKAGEHLSAAAGLFRELGMRFWLAQAETALTALR